MEILPENCESSKCGLSRRLLFLLYVCEFIGAYCHFTERIFLNSKPVGGGPNCRRSAAAAEARDTFFMREEAHAIIIRICKFRALRNSYFSCSCAKSKFIIEQFFLLLLAVSRSMRKLSRVRKSNFSTGFRSLAQFFLNSRRLTIVEPLADRLRPCKVCVNIAIKLAASKPPPRRASLSSSFFCAFYAPRNVSVCVFLLIK